jgi:hypothetical protein
VLTFKVTFCNFFGGFEFTNGAFQGIFRGLPKSMVHRYFMSLINIERVRERERECENRSKKGKGKRKRERENKSAGDFISKPPGPK